MGSKFLLVLADEDVFGRNSGDGWIMAARLSELTVLVVDDVELMRQLVRRILRDVGVLEVDLASDATLALEMIHNRDYDLVITDLLMEGMDGITLLRELRHSVDVQKAQTPVVVFSGHSDREVLKKAIDMGVEDFLVKPIAPKTLAERLKRICTHRLTAAETLNPG